jgi:hypothetical protein
MQLYRLTDEYRRLGDLLAMSADTGEIPTELEAQLSAIEGELTHKANSICSLYRELLAEGDVAKAEAERLGMRAMARRNAAERLKQYLWGELSKLGMQKLKTDLFTMWEQSSTPSIKFDGDATRLPVQFQRVTVELDRQAAMTAYKDLTPLPPGVTVEIGRHFRIK